MLLFWKWLSRSPLNITIDDKKKISGILFKPSFVLIYQWIELKNFHCGQMVFHITCQRISIDVTRRIEKGARCKRKKQAKLNWQTPTQHGKYWFSWMSVWCVCVCVVVVVVVFFSATTGAILLVCMLRRGSIRNLRRSIPIYPSNISYSQRNIIMIPIYDAYIRVRMTSLAFVCLFSNDFFLSLFLSPSRPHECWCMVIFICV